MCVVGGGGAACPLNIHPVFPLVHPTPPPPPPPVPRDPICTFARTLRPRFYLYEVYNMARRLALTGECVVRAASLTQHLFPKHHCPNTLVVVLMCETLAQSTILVLFVSILTLVVERESSPYVNRFVSAFTYALHWQIVMVSVSHMRSG